MHEFLQRILDAKAVEVEAARQACPADQLPARSVGPPRGLAAALQSPGLSVIAEIKRRSPSKGPLRADLDPVAIAEDYARHGAAAISVLTDGEFFGGSLGDLRRVRAACPLPVLRKDFVIDPYQIDEAYAAGADAILLIVRILDDSQLRLLFDHARQRGLDVLIEVHDEVETDRASGLHGAVFGVNSRDLDSFQTDLATAERLAERLPIGALRVAESGIHSRADAERMERHGYHGLLIGEAFMRAPSPGAKLAELLERVPS